MYVMEFYETPLWRADAIKLKEVEQKVVARRKVWLPLVGFVRQLHYGSITNIS